MSDFIGVDITKTRIKEEKPELLFLTTPNNPTGKLTEPAYIRRLLTVCEKTDTYLVLDECFMELTGQAAQYSMVREIDSYEKLLILRAFTKTFAMPGIRLGYLVGKQAVLSSVQKQLPFLAPMILWQLFRIPRALVKPPCPVPAG